MANELATLNGGPVDFDREQIDLIKRTVALGATDAELKLFLYTAKSRGLDPLVRQIHFVKRGDAGTIQVGIDGYRLIADRTRQYVGQDEPVFDGNLGGYPEKCTVVVWKLVEGIRCSFPGVAYWAEYVPLYRGEVSAMWRKMPRTMLAKCAEAQALRKAFPAELSGIYTEEEMAQADHDSRPVQRPRADVVTGEIIDADPVEKPRNGKWGAARAALDTKLREHGVDPDNRDLRLHIVSKAHGAHVDSTTDLTDSELTKVAMRIGGMRSTEIQSIVAAYEVANNPDPDPFADTPDVPHEEVKPKRGKAAGEIVDRNAGTLGIEPEQDERAASEDRTLAAMAR